MLVAALLGANAGTAKSRRGGFPVPQAVCAIAFVFDLAFGARSYLSQTEPTLTTDRSEKALPSSLFALPSSLFFLSTVNCQLFPLPCSFCQLSTVNSFLFPLLSVNCQLSTVPGQLFQDNFIDPRLKQNPLNLNLVVVFFALLVGARAARLLGIFLAIPLAGVIFSWL
ncbi:hypothetical protein [Microcoleus sp. herbarium12]|uniref:hypothetical protein n=1 Tax=Microcoleus sp. herbarium12 TaxID=3055437 RepID=UPI002FCF06E0